MLDFCIYSHVVLKSYLRSGKNDFLLRHAFYQWIFKLHVPASHFTRAFLHPPLFCISEHTQPAPRPPTPSAVTSARSVDNRKRRVKAEIVTKASGVNKCFSAGISELTRGNTHRIELPRPISLNCRRKAPGLREELKPHCCNLFALQAAHPGSCFS